MADPPWSFRTRSIKGQGRSPQTHYNCMPIDEIAALPVGQLAAKDAWLWLWGISPMLPHALDVLGPWGFTYSTHGVWGKLTKTGKVAQGTGFVLRGSHEVFILAKRGSPPVVKPLPSLILAQRREHSRKPEEAYRHAEISFGDVPRVELFARQVRPGWDCWGAETNHFSGGMSGAR